MGMNRVKEVNMQLADEFGKQKGKLCLEIYVDV
jgi:hypothetical protein